MIHPLPSIKSNSRAIVSRIAGTCLLLLFLALPSVALAAYQLRTSVFSNGTAAASGNGLLLRVAILGQFATTHSPATGNHTLSAGLAPAIYSGTDVDGDGYAAHIDNCPAISNSTQTNSDGDPIGDACDPDDDNDTVPDAQDNCSLLANTDQLNTDGDLAGDACDPDSDNDGVENGEDLNPVDESICRDTDLDGCDDCSNGADNFDPASNFDPDNDGRDLNGNGFCYLSDLDDDGDGWPDSLVDNCPLHYNPNQADADGDGVGDACSRDTNPPLCFPIVSNQGIAVICL